MERSANQYTAPMERGKRIYGAGLVDRTLEDIDTVLLAESQLLEALQNAVKYNSLEETEAEQVLWDFRAAHNLTVHAVIEIRGELK